jgi:hypothetical protein
MPCDATIRSTSSQQRIVIPSVWKRLRDECANRNARCKPADVQLIDSEPTELPERDNGRLISKRVVRKTAAPTSTTP